MPLRPLLLIAIFLLPFSSLLHAQRSSNRIIATDYNECLTGVKDSLGNWIIPAQYTDIDYHSNGTFRVWQYRRCGLVDSNGVLLVPVVYSSLSSPMYPGFSVVRSKGQYGVVNHNGDTIVPIIHKSVIANNDSTFFACKRKRKWTMYSFTGATHNVPYHGRTAPRQVGRHLYSVRKPRGVLRGRHALMNDSGEIVLRPKWDVISSAQNDLVCLERNKKYGFAHADGQTAWPVAFETTEHDNDLTFYNHLGNYWDYYTYTNIFSYDTVGIVHIKGKYGVITASGRTLLPLEYDSIGTYNVYSRYKYGNMYYVKKDGKYGIYSVKTGWVMQPEQEMLLPIRTFFTSTDSQTVSVFINRKNGLYGITSTSGQVFVPCRYRHFTSGNTGWLLYNSDTLLHVYTYPTHLKQLVVKSQLGMTRDSVVSSFNKSAFAGEAPGSKMFSVYPTESGGRLYFHPQGSLDTLYYQQQKFTAQPKNNLTTIPDSVLMNTEIQVEYLLPGKKIDNTHVMYVDSTRGWRVRNVPEELYVMDTKTEYVSDIRFVHRDDQHTFYQTYDEYLFRDDGLVLVQPNVWNEIRAMDSDKDKPLKFLLLKPDDTHAVINSDGTYDIPPQDGAIGYFNEKYMWIGKKTGRYGTRRWKLVERTSGKTIKWPGDERNIPIWGNYGVFETKKRGQQLYNLSTRKVITGGYNEMEGLDAQGSLFMVRTCSGKTGMIDSTGKILVDTIYNNFCNLKQTGGDYFFSSYYYYSRFRTFYRFHPFYNDTGYVVFDTKEKHLVSSTAVRDYLRDGLQTLNDTFSPKEFCNQLEYRTGISCYRSDSSHLKGWHWQNVTDTLCWPRRVENSFFGFDNMEFVSQCNYCEKKTRQHFYFLIENPRNRFVIHHAADSLLSYCTYSTYSGTQWMSNVVMFKDGPRNLTLDSLFKPGSDWRNFVINTVINYVNTHLYVRGDCHNPAAFPQMLNNRFLLSEEGIRLYPQDFKESDEELAITIPWADAMPYLRDDLKSKMPATGAK